MTRNERPALLHFRRDDYEQTGQFYDFCTEQYKSAKKLTGRQVAELFTCYGVWEYVYSCFEALHTTGVNYIVEDIDLYIEARKPAGA